MIDFWNLLALQNTSASEYCIDETQEDNFYDDIFDSKTFYEISFLVQF